jgi:hypothetical protein
MTNNLFIILENPEWNQVDINSARESIRDNAENSAEETRGNNKISKNKPWLDEVFWREIWNAATDM